jgi:hypothetical protein
LLLEFLYNLSSNNVTSTHKQRLKSWADIEDELTKGLVFDYTESDMYTDYSANEKIPKALRLYGKNEC